MGRGPRRDAIAHIRRKVHIGYNGVPQICHQKYPFPWTDPQTPLSASSLGPSDLPCQTASGSDPPFCHNALDRPTDRSTHVRTYGPTDRPRESLTTIDRCATRATRPKKYSPLYFPSQKITPLAGTKLYCLVTEALRSDAQT